MDSKVNNEERQLFLNIILDIKERESILQEYGEKGFDVFTGYLDWEFLELYEIIEEELNYLEKAREILSDEVSEELLNTYELDTTLDYFGKIEYIVDNLKRRIGSGSIIQKYPEIEVMLSLAADAYLNYFNEDLVEFKKPEQGIIVRKLLRTLVEFYSNLKQREDVTDEYNVIGRKLIILISMLDQIKISYNLEEILTEEEEIECEHLVNERIIRATMMDEIYRKKRKEQEKKKELRNVCREVIADLSRAVYYQWILDYDEVEPILKTLMGKMKMYMKEGVELPYEKMIEEIKEETFYPRYLRRKEEEEEWRRKFMERIEEVEEGYKERREREEKREKRR